MKPSGKRLKKRPSFFKRFQETLLSGDHQKNHEYIRYFKICLSSLSFRLVVNSTQLSLCNQYLIQPLFLVSREGFLTIYDLLNKWISEASAEYVKAKAELRWNGS